MERRGAAAAIAILRVPNALTAAADVLAGFGAAGGAFHENRAALPLLMAASALLYAGGVALNDVVDADEDRRHRPSRPIPSGAIERSRAAVVALAAGCAGLLLAASGGAATLLTALGLVAAILAYDLLLKRSGPAGALALGVCRALNMGLGASLAASSAFALPQPAFAFGAYVTALGAVGLGEERGTSAVRHRAGLAALLAGAAAAPILCPNPLFGLAVLLPFLAPLGLRCARAVRESRPADALVVRSAVREGVLAIPGIDAAILAGHSRWTEAAAVVAIALLARLVARRLAVA